MKILLIEDDKNLCEMLCFQLEKEHHTVEVCMDGRDGLDLVLQDAYDLILLDRMLPTMNGLLVLQKARSKGISTPVIMITALGELYDRVEGLDCGADDYLVKPFAYEELSARIRSIGRRNHVYDDNNRFSSGDFFAEPLDDPATPGASYPRMGRGCPGRRKQSRYLHPFCAQTLTTGGKPRNHRDGAGNWLLYQITHGRKRCFKNYTGN